MSCARTRSRLSAYRDRELAPGDARAVAAHLESCRPCAEHWRGMERALDALGDLEGLHASESIAGRVLDRLDVESRGPGLALLFRPAWAARPLMLPSLVQASLVVVALLTGTLAIDTHFGPGARGPVPDPVLGSVGSPLALLGDLPVPRTSGPNALAERLLTFVGEGNLFVETVIGPDGSVVAVRLIEGDAEGVEPLLDALMQERFEPTLHEGRRVAVSIFRLISRTEVLVSAS